MGFAARLRASLPDFAHLPGRVAVAAWDLDEREPVMCAAERGVPAASTIKVLILVAALREVHEGRWNHDALVELPKDRVGGFGVLRELTSVSRMSLRDVLTLMVVMSDNVATNLVIDALGFDAINACAQDLGCTGTRVERRLFDDEARQRGLDNVTTALDQACVLDRLSRGEALPWPLTRHALKVLSRQQVRDRLPALLPESAGCWNKTGDQDALRHDVGLIGRGSRPQAVVAVLVDGLTDERSRGVHGGPACAFIGEVGARVFAALSRDDQDSGMASIDTE
jgi:beta-lactamase class A